MDLPTRGWPARVELRRRAFTAAGLAQFIAAGLWAQAVSHPPLTVAGSVVNELGEPLAGIRVALERWPPEFAEGRGRLAGHASPAVVPVDDALVGEAGRYRLVAPAAGLYRVALVAAKEQGVATPTYIPLLPLVAPVVLAPIELPTLRPLHVLTLDGAGRPVGGVSVWVSPHRAFARRAAVTETAHPERRLPILGRAFARTGAEGRARFVIPAAVKASIVVSASGFAVLVQDVAVDEAVLRLVRDTPIRFRVLGVGGQPTPDVLIRVGGPVDAPIASTDEYGEALANGFRDRVTTFEFRSPDRAFRKLRVPPSPGSAEVRKIDVRLEAPYRIAGQVVDVATGEGVQGASVWLESVPGLHAETGLSGSFNVAIGPEQPHEDLLLAASGYVSPMGAASARLGETPGALLGLVPAALVGGVVVDGFERPIADADILVEPVGGTIGRRHVDSHRTATGPDGAFWVENVPYGSAYELTVQAHGFARSLRRIPGIERGVPSDSLRMVLTSGRPVRGTVVDVAGLPVTGAAIRLVSALQEPELGVTLLDNEAIEDAVSGSDGRFEFPGIDGRRFTLLVEHPEHPTLAAEIELSTQQDETDLGVFTVASGAEIEGLVVDESERPIVGASVSSMQRRESSFHLDRTAVTGEDGRFRLAGLLPKLVDLSVSADGFGPEGVPGVRPAAEDPILIELTAGAVLAGRVLDETGSPFAGGAVILAAEGVAPGLSSDHRILGVETDAGGRFRFDGLSGGIWVAESWDSLGGAATGRVELLPGESRELELKLQRRDQLSVDVTNHLGQPLGSAEITVTYTDRLGRREFGWTDASGQVSLAVRPGPALVSARLRGQPATSRRLVLEPGRNELSIRLEAGWEIIGTVRSDDGALLGQAVVEATAGADNSGQRSGSSALKRLLDPPVKTVSGSDGGFRLAGLAGGVYRLTARLPGLVMAGPAPSAEIDGHPLLGSTLCFTRVFPSKAW